MVTPVSSTKTEGVRDYFEIGIIGYGSKSDTAESLLPNSAIVPISKMAENPIRIEKTTKKITDSEGEEVETEMEFPVWFEPVANFNTLCLGAPVNYFIYLPVYCVRGLLGF